MKSTQNDIPTENYKINDYLNRVKDIRKRSIILLITLLAGERQDKKVMMNYKRSLDLWPIVTEFFKFTWKIKSKSWWN
ncbi:hypothetical protein HYD61_02055 [Mycoplasmopsis bovis]|nr:hypothetical protein [Mycoplasmopsis bovis]QQH60591.1 hypothetical protein HYD61_02055 [Mycoplasmopsis bovis]